MKRAIDMALASAALLLLSPLLLATAITIAISLGRPVLFRQRRTGLHGQEFTLIKFRSMRTPLPGEDALATDAERMTALGRWLRATSMDELPTLWNVVRGDMALVGPRPLLPEYLPFYSREQARRHEVRPGITGWAQVHGRNAITWEERFRLDVWYVDHRSLGLDLSILWRTLRRVVGRHGVSAPGHVTMPPFHRRKFGNAAQ